MSVSRNGVDISATTVSLLWMLELDCFKVPEVLLWQLAWYRCDSMLRAASLNLSQPQSHGRGYSCALQSPEKQAPSDS